VEPHTLVTAERVVATAGRANPDALREQLGLPQGLEKMSKRDMVALARSLGREASATESLAALRGKLVDGSLALQVGAGVEERQRLPRAETAPASGSRSRPKRDTSLPFSNSMWTQVQSPLMAPGATLLLNRVTVGKDEQFEEFENSVRRRWVVEQGVDGWRENHKAHAAAASASAGAAEPAPHSVAAAAEAPSGPSSPLAEKPGPQLHSMVLDMKVEKGHREQLKGKDRDPAKGDQFRGGSKKAHRMGGGMWTTMTSSSRWRLAHARPGRGGKKTADAEKAPQEKLVRLKVKLDGNAAVSPSPPPSAASDGLAGPLAGVEVGAEPLPADPLLGRAPASRRPHTTPHLTRHHHHHQHRHSPAGVGAPLGNQSSRGGGFGPAKRDERGEVSASASTSAPATNLAAAAAGPTAAAAGGAGGAQRLHIDAKGNIHHVVYVGVPQLPAAAATLPARASFKLNPSAQHGGVGAGALTAEIFATHYLSSPPMY